MLYTNTPTYNTSITLVEGKLRTRIPTQNILFIQSEHVYVRIFLQNGRTILYRCALREILQQLPAQSFSQIHRCYIANLRWVNNFDGKCIRLAQHTIPVSRTYRKLIREQLRSPRHLMVQNRNQPLQYKAG